jgi:hypothetical protein
MIPPLDPSHASEAAPPHEEPGFYLVDDAGGRFIVDRQWGIVSVANDDVLAREPGAVHGVTLRVIEPSGATYQLPMQLRLTGRVPQMVGAEEFSMLASMADGLADQIASGSSVVATPEPQPSAPPAPTIAWSQFSAANAKPGKAALPEQNFATPLPIASPRLADAGLSMPEMTLAPAPVDADWSL